MAYDKMMRQIMERLDRIEAMLAQQGASAPPQPKLPAGAVSATIETVEMVVADKEPAERAVPRRTANQARK